MMLEFRRAAFRNDLPELERLSLSMGDDFNIDEPGPTSGKTAAHVAAEKAHFKAIYWLFEKGANFSCKDNEGKTATDYLQQQEFASIHSNSLLKEDRKYHLCNAHYKIWFAHDPECFMPYLYQDDFKQYRKNNPDGYISLVYSEALLNAKALSDLQDFAKKYEITLISFETDLKTLTTKFGTKEDQQCYQLASDELKSYPNQKGGNLAVVADLIRWSSVLLRKGSYSDTDVLIGEHKWTNSISMEKSFALNLGSLIYSNGFKTPWINGDIIAVSSLFSKPHQGDFRITLSKTACCMIQKAQSSLLLSCQKNMQGRINKQQYVTKTLSNFTKYLKSFFKYCDPEGHNYINKHFLPDEINKIQKEGLKLFSEEECASIIKRMANFVKIKLAKEYGSMEMAKKYSSVLKSIQDDEYEKILMNYMLAMQMVHIKESIKNLTGSPIFGIDIVEYFCKDEWEKYSIYSSELVTSAFRSTNTVKFNTDNEENERLQRTQKCADLSFTSFGMKGVLQRSEALKEEHKIQLKDLS